MTQCITVYNLLQKKKIQGYVEETMSVSKKSPAKILNDIVKGNALRKEQFVYTHLHINNFAGLASVAQSLMLGWCPKEALK